MKISFITLGCKVNAYESDAIMNMFKARGELIVDTNTPSDVVIINTCSVTNQASAKSRKLIRSAIRNNPGAIIAVLGCYSQMSKDEVASIPGVSIVIGNANKSAVVDLVYREKEKRELVVKVEDILHHKEFEELSPIEFSHTRAFLKIEDGCNNFCSYCIIPFTRGPVRCKNADKVIEDVSNIVNNGYQEIVLTGIHTGRYNDQGVTFTAIVKRILNETKLARLRISSIELNEVTDEFLTLMKNNSVIARHLHIPLQAGSNHVLKMMRRHYTREEFIDRIKYIKEYIPDISITTDIIVGFPEETEEDFLETLDLARTVGFAKIHCFPFSLRAGTKACEYKEVSDNVKNLRMEKLMALDKELVEAHQNKYLDTECDIIIEDQHDDYLVGHSSNFLTVYVPYQKNMSGAFVHVKIKSLKGGKLYGEYFK